MSYEQKRRLMVEEQLMARGIRDERVLSAMERVPRHAFVNDDLQGRAYEDGALPIGEGQTISQPYMVALMSELLQLTGEETVLEIGTGSGYQAALLSLLAREVFTVERIPGIAEQARCRLKELGYDNITVVIADGTKGLLEEAPFDGIMVAAGSPDIPPAYMNQLNRGGRLVIPVGGRYSQTLWQVKKTGAGTDRVASTTCVFVPLIGKHGWSEADAY